MSDNATISLAEASERLSFVRNQIKEALKASGRQEGEVTLLAVSKTFPQETINAFWQAGQGAFGENYIQEAREKIPSLSSSLQWHFIGHLQTNKAKYAASLFSVLHTLDSLELAAELNKRLLALSKTILVYIQVNVSGEDSKSGLSPAELPVFLDALAPFSNLKVEGLMTMPPYDPDPEVSRPHFAALRELRNRVAPHLKGLSMGMSGDFQVAISEGATIIRVGTALFGPR
jgi:pyridoxal phosphate enzyme (YggS family)